MHKQNHSFKFIVNGDDHQARCGLITTPHGIINTPAFMPVGTAATVKAVFPEDVRASGAEILLANTYHLMLRPGAEKIERFGGLHKFMNWHLPILTDSGGFQVMSLARLCQITDNAARFRSHIDGSYYELTPERAVEIQGMLGSDIQMQLDECLRLPATTTELNRAMRLSLAWAERSLQKFKSQAKPGQALFGIIQGGDNLDLRRESLNNLQQMDFNGYAIGGLAVGEPQADMLMIIDHLLQSGLTADKPRYLMGVGTPDDLLKCVALGIDMFDCVMPTRAGRHGQAFTSAGKINLRNARYSDDLTPIDSKSSWDGGRIYSKAYINHLLKAKESLAGMILTMVNLSYYQQLMAGARTAIANRNYADYVAMVNEGWHNNQNVKL